MPQFRLLAHSRAQLRLSYPLTGWRSTFAEMRRHAASIEHERVESAHRHQIGFIPPMDRQHALVIDHDEALPEATLTGIEARLLEECVEIGTHAIASTNTSG